MAELMKWAWWIALISPAFLTPLITLYFARKVDQKFGWIRSVAISAVGAIPLAAFIVIDASFSGQFTSRDVLVLTVMVLAVWISFLGVGLVDFTQWLYLRFVRSEQRYKK